ncbi:MAG: hypothetical protein ACK4GN_12550 [Runella sp.]
MKRTNFWLLLLGTWSVAVICSCKNDNIEPIDFLLRYYCGGGFIENMKLERKEGNRISIKAKNVFYKRGISSNGGWEEFYKNFEFPNCEIAIIDTVIQITNNNGNQQQFYARITNKDDNTVFGEITKWKSFQTQTPITYLRLTLKKGLFPFIDSLNFGRPPSLNNCVPL